MKRTAPKRRTKLRSRRPTARRVAPDRVRSEAYKARVRALGFCSSARMPGARCEGPIEASHNDYDGTKGAGLKTSDLTCVPQCWRCHKDVAVLKGPFEGWSYEMRKQWFAEATAHTQQLLGRGGLDTSTVPF